ncbi:isoprenylcysteine carboxylmethyltransferase family protein [Novosphingobium sp. TH158]|uniref:methyltransferase family protein n=1 Tax=Novosphingobium sp. TH158 TaxID=2067455 RepID=UPI000C7E2947|nr:isoprenylcysteine carboxylmethyltransferase family protein [Novosphingobium sp. TH158]PLK27551.1 isoprenylcysteine carboxyl methyltransferase [Novosphingobium sp. TH158]
MTTTVESQVRSAAPSWLTPRFADRAEQVAIVILWGILAWRVEFSDNPWAPLLLLSESTIAFFTLIRRPTEKLSMRLGDWLLAMTATCAGLLVVPGVVLVEALVPLAVLLFIGGNLFQLWAKLVLRRSFGVAPANRGVKISGPYRYVRHPMYLGYGIVHLSLLLLMFWPLNIVIYAIGWWAQILRILAEERVLSQDPAYAEYMKQVKWRLIPGVF